MSDRTHEHVGAGMVLMERSCAGSGPGASSVRTKGVRSASLCRPPAYLRHATTWVYRADRGHWHPSTTSAPSRVPRRTPWTATDRPDADVTLLVGTRGSRV